MKTARTTSVLSMFILAATAAACGDTGQAETPAPTAKNPDVIEIALIASLSGADQGVGAEAQRGALTAIGQLNALGGVLGKQLALRIVDDQSTPSITAAKMQELADAGVIFGVGPSTSRTAKEILPLVKADKVLYVTPSATSKELDCLEFGATAEETERLCEAARDAFDPTATLKPMLFKTASSDAFLATALAQYASEVTDSKTRRCKSIAILRQNDAYGIPIAEKLLQRYQQLNLGVRQPLIDLDPMVDRTETLKGAAAQVGKQPVPDCQVVIALPAVGGAYMRTFKDWREQNPGILPDTFQTIGSDGFRQDQFIVEGRVRQNDPASITAGEGSVAVASDTAPNTPEYNSFLTVFESAYPGIAPGRYSSTAYDAVVTLAGAMEKARTSTEIPAVRKALVDITTGRRTAGPARLGEFLQLVRENADVNYEGASGPLDFDPQSGGVRNDFGIWKITESKFVRVRTLDRSELTGE